MTAIVAALSSADISRLHLTWAHTGRNHQFEVLSKLNEPTSNFSALRAVMQAVEGPCVPFIGIYLTDLVHIQDQMRDNVQFPPSQKTHRTHRGAHAASTSPVPPVHENERMCQASAAGGGMPNGRYHHPLSASPPSSLSSPRSIASFATCQSQSTGASFVSASSSLSSSTNGSGSTSGPAPLGPPLINFVKRIKFYDSVRAILRFQSKPLTNSNSTGNSGNGSGDSGKSRNYFVAVDRKEKFGGPSVGSRGSAGGGHRSQSKPAVATRQPCMH